MRSGISISILTSVCYRFNVVSCRPAFSGCKQCKGNFKLCVGAGLNAWLSTVWNTPGERLQLCGSWVLCFAAAQTTCCSGLAGAADVREVVDGADGIADCCVVEGGEWAEAAEGDDDDGEAEVGYGGGGGRTGRRPRSAA